MSDNDDGGGDDDDSLLLEGSHIDSETQALRVGQALSPADLCTFASVRAVGAGDGSGGDTMEMRQSREVIEQRRWKKGKIEN